jgi:hypothetical protein
VYTLGMCFFSSQIIKLLGILLQVKKLGLEANVIVEFKMILRQKGGRPFYLDI